MRLSREELAITIAELIAQRGTCNRAKVGAVIISEGRIISTGYNGAPSGLPHCTDVGCELKNDSCIRTAHAEAGAIAFAARKGISTEGATMFCTLSPCVSCAKLIINAGIKTFMFDQSYKDDSGIKLLLQAGLRVGRRKSSNEK